MKTISCLISFWYVDLCHLYLPDALYPKRRIKIGHIYLHLSSTNQVYGFKIYNKKLSQFVFTFSLRWRIVKKKEKKQNEKGKTI